MPIVNIKKNIIESNLDYLEMLKEFGLNEEKVREQIESADFEKVAGKIVPEETKKYIVKHSLINGKGVFTCINFPKNYMLGHVLINNNRTLLARYVNHSSNNNAIFHRREDGTMVAFLIKDVKKGEEILVNYRDHTKKYGRK